MKLKIVRAMPKPRRPIPHLAVILVPDDRTEDKLAIRETLPGVQKKSATPTRAAITKRIKKTMPNISLDVEDHEPTCGYRYRCVQQDSNCLTNEEMRGELIECYRRKYRGFSMRQIADMAEEALVQSSPVGFYLQEQRKTFHEYKMLDLEKCRCPRAQRPCVQPTNANEDSQKFGDGQGGSSVKVIADVAAPASDSARVEEEVGNSTSGGQGTNGASPKVRVEEAEEEKMEPAPFDRAEAAEGKAEEVKDEGKEEVSSISGADGSKIEEGGEEMKIEVVSAAGGKDESQVRETKDEVIVVAASSQDAWGKAEERKDEEKMEVVSAGGDVESQAWNAKDEEIKEAASGQDALGKAEESKDEEKMEVASTGKADEVEVKAEETATHRGSNVLAMATVKENVDTGADTTEEVREDEKMEVELATNDETKGFELLPRHPLSMPDLFFGNLDESVADAEAQPSKRSIVPGGDLVGIQI